MQTVPDKIQQLCQEFSNQPIADIDKLPQAGSERHYFRIHTGNKTYIATYGANLKENESFIYFSKHFNKKKLSTPEILAISFDKIVVRRLMCVDHTDLQQQRLLLRCYLKKFHISCFSNHILLPQRTRSKVLLQSFSQMLCLSNIQNLPSFSFEEIDAWLGRNMISFDICNKHEFNILIRFAVSTSDGNYLNPRISCDDTISHSSVLHTTSSLSSVSNLHELKLDEQ